MEKMVDFYSKVFEIDFEKISYGMPDKKWNRYLGKFGELLFHITPNKTSGTEKGQKGVHQFHIKPDDIGSFTKKASKLGFNISECDFGEGKIQYLLRDPDGHPWIIR